ncbi:hypothetical protein AB3N59_14815 [Leptospira sp. WS92.C1]
MENKKRYNRISEESNDKRLAPSKSLLSIDDIQKIYEFDGSEKVTPRKVNTLLLSRYKNQSISGLIVRRGNH